MITVAYVFPNGDLGGAELATARILRAHDQTQVNPVALLMTPGPMVDLLHEAGVLTEIAPHRPRLSNGRERRAARRWIADQLTRHNVGLQHSVMAWTHAMAGPATRRTGVVPVWSQHTPPRLTGAIDWWAAFTSARLIVANSAYTARLQRQLNLRRAPISVVRPPVGDLTPRSPVEETRRVLGAAAGDILAVVPGRLERNKGQDVAIRALARAAVPNLRLAIVGQSAFGLDEGFPSELSQLATTLGVGEQVQLTGFQTAMGDVYAAADVVLQPSRRPEGFGLVTAEALAAGCPVVASDTGALHDLVEHKVNGLLVAPSDVQALADALAMLARDDTRRADLSAAALGTPHQTAAGAAQSLEELYRRVLGT